MFLSLFVKNCIFASLTLKLSFWPWRWPWVIKIIQEMDCPVKITWKWGITLVPGFICWKIIFDLEIFGGHFVFALKKFRPRVPKWHPADSCSGHPLEPESIIKHRPYLETRLSKKMPFDNWTNCEYSKDKKIIFGKKPKSSIDVHFFFNDLQIETTTQYKYLGCIFESSSNIVKEYSSHTLSKANKATYKVPNYCVPLGNPPSEVTIK